MHIKTTLRLRQVAALLLASGSTIVAAANDSGSAQAIKPYAEAAGLIQPAATSTETTAQRQACHFGMCQEPRFDEPKVETVVGSDVMPMFSSPALRAPGEAEAGC